MLPYNSISRVRWKYQQLLPRKKLSCPTALESLEYSRLTQRANQDYHRYPQNLSLGIPLTEHLH